jgi:phytoene desaturase
LASLGFSVTVFEKNAYPGGKCCELSLKNYRFDKGPSLFTMPHLVDELLALSPQKIDFEYEKLNTITHYFYEDGTNVIGYANKDALAKELQVKLGEETEQVIAHLKEASFFYKVTAPVFLTQSIHKFKYLFNLNTLKGIFLSFRLRLFSTMHEVNAKRFKNEKTVQLFNRFATYNGSSPYMAPALLNIIPHLESSMGAYLPKKGMSDISNVLVACAKSLGVKFLFNQTVTKILLENNRAVGLISNEKVYNSDITLANADMHVVYKKLLPQHYTPHKLLNQPKSSSAYIFYWGIRSKFPQLHLHNILFSQNYQKEFECLFNSDDPYEDPTIYINITSKLISNDAPLTGENWFVMVNVPHNHSHNPINYSTKLRKLVIEKINRMLNTSIEELIEVEEILDPFSIETQTSSWGGSLYGNASNSKWAAFLRHANFSSKIRNLYFSGGSVHPGGGIPLALLSGKIVSNIIKDDHC